MSQECCRCSCISDALKLILSPCFDADNNFPRDVHGARMPQSIFTVLLTTVLSVTSVTEDTSLIKQSDFTKSRNPDCKAVLYHSPDINPAVLKEYIEAYTFACEYFGDIRTMEIWLTSNDEAAAAKLRQRWCQHRLRLDSSFRDSYCNDSQIGVYLNNYVHWFSIDWRPGIDEHHQVNLADQHSLESDGAESTMAHEFFHAYQYSHLDLDIYQTWQSRDLNMGRSEDASKPWHSEGSASFFGSFLVELMGSSGALRNYLAYYVDPTGGNCQELIDENFSLWDLEFDTRNNCGYGLGAWAITLLISQNSIASYLAFYDDLNPYGFFDAWSKNFGRTVDEFDVEFREWFLTTSDDVKFETVNTLVVSEQSETLSQAISSR